LLDKGVVRQGDEVFVGDGRVGVVTSGTVTPYWVFSGSGVMATPTDETGRRAIALARVDAAVQTGREVEVVVRGRRLRARIVPCHGRSDAPPYYRPIPADVPQFSAAAGGAASRPSDPAQAAVALLERGFANDRWRQEQCVNLIPSEMTPSPLVRLLSVSDPSGRYAEHKELFGTFGREVFYYQGTDFIAWVEERLVEEMSRYLGCPHVEVRPLSGQMANAAVFGALVDARHRANPRGDLPRLRCVMNHPIGRGGHLSAQPMGALRDFVAKDPVTERFAVAGFPVCRDNPYRVDVEATGRLLDETDPDLLVFGKSMVLHREPVAEIAGLLAAAGKRPVLMYDMAHVLGLAGPHFQEPFREGIHVVTGSTHKTFFGPQRGVVGWAASGGAPMDPLGAAIRRRVFPGMVSNHHLGTQLGLLLAAMEMNAFRDAYQRQVLANAKALARALRGEGVEVEGDAAIDFTETHQVMVRVGYARGAEVARRLEENHLVVNFQALPDDESFTSSSGLRMGVAEMTRFGMGEGDFEALAGLLAEVIERGRTVRNEVVRFRSRFRAMRYCFDAEIPESLKARWLATF
jgi:aminomethyltransferase